MKVLLCGLGAIGSIYATKLKDANVDLKILIDKKRQSRYLKNGIYFNNCRYDFEYILPDKRDYKPELIIIAVKSSNLHEVIYNIKNFVSENTIIVSLLNGISSEKRIQAEYPQANIIKSYYVGHASMKKDNRIFYDGVGKIVMEENQMVKSLFDITGIEYEVSEDIDSSMWQKFIINIGVNQTTAVLKETYECFKDKKTRQMAEMLMQEGIEIAKHLGIKDSENFMENAFKLIYEMPVHCKTSMMQDIENLKETEVDIFAGEICRLGKIYGIKTPQNKKIYNAIKKIEKSY